MSTTLHDQRRIDAAGERGALRSQFDRVAAEHLEANASTTQQAFEAARHANEVHEHAKRRLSGDALAQHGWMTKAYVAAAHARYEHLLRADLDTAEVTLRRRRTAHGPAASHPQWRAAVDSVSEMNDHRQMVDALNRAVERADVATTKAIFDVALSRFVPEVLDRWTELHPSDRPYLDAFRSLHRQVHDRSVRLARSFYFTPHAVS